MAIPTQAQLYEEVDRRFAAEHPDAPTRLDPDDPNQQQWVHQWLHIRDETANEWTNHVFFENFPYAGKLDPGNPADADMINYWNDIHHQMTTGEQGHFNWDGPPPLQPLVITSVENHPTGAGFIIRFNRTLQDLTEAEQFLFHQDHPPVGGTLGFEDGASVHLELTLDALRSLPDENLARMLSELSVMRSE
jgi:hypothetical protein